MIWPTAADFSQIVQNPGLAFRDPMLQGSLIERNKLNQPRPWAGQFAVVYKAIRPGEQGPIAVRAFTSPAPERRERYEHVTTYLDSQKLDCLAKFEYRESAIRGPKGWYPLVVMEWIEGVTFFHWVDRQCRKGQSGQLADAAEAWVEIVRQLHEASIAHGDLQHGNVMVTESGGLKLVDYDGMCVPALVGRQNLEVGIEPYQHPERNGETLLSPDLDNFSSLVIYVALRALAAEPRLWLKYVDEMQYDKLLFRREDFQARHASPLFQDLCQSPDREVRRLAVELFAAAAGRLEQVPSLDRLLQSAPQRKAAKHLSKLLTALNMEDQRAFIEWFDVRLVRCHPDVFKPHQPLLTRWVGQLVRQPDNLGLGDALARASLWQEQQSPGVAFARWCWPELRLVDRCCLGFCPAPPGDTAGPGDVEVHDLLMVDRGQMEREGGYQSLRVEPQWAKDYIVVWAEIDLGFHVFHSRPLVLGRLGECPFVENRPGGLLARLRKGLRRNAPSRPQLHSARQEAPP